jgi:ankyrin repeat protein
MLKHLQSKGADLGATENAKLSGLHAAAMNQHPEMVAYLLEQGMDPNLKAKDGLTPLHCAARSGSLECATLLVEHGAEVNAAGPNGITPTFGAFYMHFPEIGKYLHSKGGELTGTTQDGMTLLHMLAQFNDSQSMEWLLQQGLDPDARQPKSDWTPLMIAAGNGAADCVKVLLEAGADKSLKDVNGNTASEIAELKQQKAMAEMIDAYKNDATLSGQ